MLVKDKVIETIQSLPEEFSLDDLVERLILLEKIEAGLAQMEKGETLTQEEAKARLRKWQR